MRTHAWSHTHANTNTLNLLTHTLPHGEVVKGHGWLGAAGWFRPEWQSSACWDVWIQMQSSMKAWGRSLLFFLSSPPHSPLPFSVVFLFKSCLCTFHTVSPKGFSLIHPQICLSHCSYQSITHKVYPLWVLNSSSQFSLAFFCLVRSIDFHLTSISHYLFL